MNQSFDAGRWWLLVGKHWSENRKKYSLSLIAIAGLMLLWFIVVLFSDGVRAVNSSIQSSGYYFGLFAGGCLFGSILFADLGSKTKGLNYLLVPTSHFEKLLCNLFYAVVVYFVCYTAIFYLLDFIMINIGNAAMHSHWLKHHNTGDTFEPQKIVNVFYQPEHSRDAGDLIYLLLAYFVVQSVFICGSVYFTKFSFIKTVIASLLIGLVIVFFIVKVVAHILPSGYYYHGITSYEINTVKELPASGGTMIYSDPETDKLVSIPEWLGDVILFVLKFAFAPLFWLATYYRLKEKEI